MELKSVEAVICALNSAGIRYLIVGGLAVNAHGFERMTRDIDLVIQLDEINCKSALRSLLQIDYQLAIPESPESFANPEK